MDFRRAISLVAVLLFFFPSLLCRCPRGQGDSGVGVAGLRSATVSWHSNVAEVCQGQNKVVERESKRPMPELHAVSREWANRGGNQQGGRKGFLMLFERAEEKSDARWCAVRRLLTIRGVWQGNWEMGERTRKRQAKTRKGPGKTAGGRYLGPASRAEVPERLRLANRCRGVGRASEQPELAPGWALAGAGGPLAGI